VSSWAVAAGIVMPVDVLAWRRLQRSAECLDDRGVKLGAGVTFEFSDREVSAGSVAVGTI
jgi:hypothetical protein